MDKIKVIIADDSDFVIGNKKSLCHNLGRPSRSDFVQFQFVGGE